MTAEAAGAPSARDSGPGTVSGVAHDTCWTWAALAGEAASDPRPLPPGLHRLLGGPGGVSRSWAERPDLPLALVRELLVTHPDPVVRGRLLAHPGLSVAEAAVVAERLGRWGRAVVVSRADLDDATGAETVAALASSKRGRHALGAVVPRAGDRLGLCGRPLTARALAETLEPWMLPDTLSSCDDTEAQTVAIARWCAYHWPTGWPSGLADIAQLVSGLAAITPTPAVASWLSAHLVGLGERERDMLGLWLDLTPVADDGGGSASAALVSMCWRTNDRRRLEWLAGEAVREDHARDWSPARRQWGLVDALCRRRLPGDLAVRLGRALSTETLMALPGQARTNNPGLVEAMAAREAEATEQSDGTEDRTGAGRSRVAGEAVGPNGRLGGAEILEWLGSRLGWGSSFGAAFVLADEFSGSWAELAELVEMLAAAPARVTA